jgi:hypothetical protein
MSSALLPGPTPINWTDAEFHRMVALGVRFTRDQFRDLRYQVFFSDRRVGFIHGEVIEMPVSEPPSGRN